MYLFLITRQKTKAKMNSDNNPEHLTFHHIKKIQSHNITNNTS